MKKPKSKKPTYADFLSGFRQTISADSLPMITFFWGESDYLVQKAAEAFRARVDEDVGEKYQSLEASEVNEDFIFQMFNEVSLFDSKSYYLVRRVEQVTSFQKYLSKLSDEVSCSNHLMLTAEGGKKPVHLMKQVERLGGVVVPCFPPFSSELPKVVAGVCKKNDLKIGMEGVHFLIETLGNDLFTLENEIKKLSFCFTTNLEPVGPSELSPHLGNLKEEHVFALTDKLLSKDYAEAQIFVEELLMRGESSIALLGIIARHCRNSIYFKGMSQNSPSVDKPRLPFDVVKRYNVYTKGVGLEAFLRVLIKCQKADLALKTQGLSNDKLVLSEVLEAFHR